MANMGDIASKAANRMAAATRRQITIKNRDYRHYGSTDERDKAIAIAEELDRMEMERRKNEPELEFGADGKVKEPDVPEGSAEFFWRAYSTECAMCGTKRERGRGYLFCGMTPEGEMKTFCNVNCCDAWELIGDNTNARRAAIKAQKARKEQL